jgi:hypothetical protein
MRMPCEYLAVVALGFELLVHLRPKAMHQHNLDAHALDHGQVLRQMGSLPAAMASPAMPTTKVWLRNLWI